MSDLRRTVRFATSQSGQLVVNQTPTTGTTGPAVAGVGPRKGPTPRSAPNATLCFAQVILPTPPSDEVFFATPRRPRVPAW